MKLSSLIQARKTIEGKAQEPVSARLAYKLMKFIKGSEDENTFYSERLGKIAEKYAARDETGKLVCHDGGIEIKPEYMQECKDELQKLGDTIVDVPAVFTLEELSELKLSVSEMFALGDLILEDG